MSLINWNSNDPFDRFDRRMNLFFNHNTDPWWATRRHRQSGEGQLTSSDFLNPATDIYETENGWNIHVELPGVQKDNIKVDVNDNSITLSAESKANQEYTRENARYQERRFGTYSRTFPLPDNVDREKIDAKFQDGVLDLLLPRGEASKSRKVLVN
ncbi:hypothetical protein BGZ76_001706 [Entomortierella beljakovae]|nr:hypothetical protein BGZ76_001706 [Entomortierella beljakovae]